MIDRLANAAESTTEKLFFPGTVFYRREQTNYGYELSWDGSFWYGGARHKRPDGPSPVVLCGHGAFLVHRPTYERLGGYTNEQRGYGGEETFLNLLFLMNGCTPLLIPEAYHWHYPGPRRRFGLMMREPRFARNFMLAAYVMGGEGQLAKVARWYAPRVGERAILDAQRELPRDAAVIARREAVSRGPFSGDIDRLRREVA